MAVKRLIKNENDRIKMMIDKKIRELAINELIKENKLEKVDGKIKVKV